MSSASLLGSANSGGVFGSGSTPQQIATGAGAAVSAFGQSAADLLQAQGAGSQVSQYQRAAQLAGMNEDIVKQSTAIQSTQQQRAATIAIGTETATMAGNGFSLGGSNGAILRSSARQAALANSQILSQGQIQENQYVAQQQSDLAQAQAAQIAENAAKTNSSASLISGILGLVGTVAAPFTGGASLLLTAAAAAYQTSQNTQTYSGGTDAPMGGGSNPASVDTTAGVGGSALP